jgi:hypothetical protein
MLLIFHFAAFYKDLISCEFKRKIILIEEILRSIISFSPYFIKAKQFKIADQFS